MDFADIAVLGSQAFEEFHLLWNRNKKSRENLAGLRQK